MRVKINHNKNVQTKDLSYRIEMYLFHNFRQKTLTLKKVKLEFRINLETYPWTLNISIYLEIMWVINIWSELSTVIMPLDTVLGIEFDRSAPTLL